MGNEIYRTYITKSQLEDLVNDRVCADNSEYISVDKIIKELQRVEGVQIPPIRKNEVIAKVEALDNIISTGQEQDKCIFALPKQTIENASNNQISRQTIIRWCDSMVKIGYKPKMSDWLKGCRNDLINLCEVRSFLQRMMNDQE